MENFACTAHNAPVPRVGDDGNLTNRAQHIRYNSDDDDNQILDSVLSSQHTKS